MAQPCAPLVRTDLVISSSPAEKNILNSKQLRRALLGIGALLAAACHGAGPKPAPSPAANTRTVIVLGFDGFARRYLDADSAPALHALARSGVTARAMIPSFPTITFPNFYAL